LFPALTVLILGAIWGATLNLIKVERSGAEAAAAAASLELVNTYKAQVVRALREIDQTLKLVEYVYETRGASAALSDLTAKTLLPPGLLFVVRIVDSDGAVLASTRPEEAPPAGDLGYLSLLSGADTLWVDEPRKSPLSRDWTLQFGRRLNASEDCLSTAALVQHIIKRLSHFV
jgi:hypothetical protein